MAHRGECLKNRACIPARKLPIHHPESHNTMGLFTSILRTALRTLAANKMRSLLTMLGIIIGVASVMAMLALGEGAQDTILTSVREMGTNRLMIRPGFRGRRGVTTDRTQAIEVADARELLRRADLINAMTPEVRGSVTAKFGTRNVRVGVIGAANTYFAIYNFTLEKGRAFTEGEELQQRRVCVLGPQVARDLFGEGDVNPVGKYIRINRAGFLVVGVTQAKGDQGFFNPDNQIYLPYTTAMRRVLGTTDLALITAHIADERDIPEAEAQIRAVLRDIRRLTSGRQDDFIIMNSAEFLRELERFSMIFRGLLGGVAGVSLLVGGIGIMNIMLVTVTERTREIGIRKAVGARNRSILLQFVIESVVVCLIGGLIGILVGAGIVYGFNAATAHIENMFRATISLWALSLGLGFSVGIGLFFGLYPAIKASRLDPIDALRYE